MKTKKKGYGLLFALTILFTLAAFSTLIPNGSASKACFLGYYALCSFTPVSTIICLVIVWVLCVLRKKKYTEET